MGLYLDGGAFTMFGSAALLDELFLALAASLASYVLYTTCRLYAPPKASALASLAFSFGTSLWPFSTALFPHAASLLFLTLALCAALTYGAGKGGAQSYNWSGYMVAASPGSVTDVRGSWVVPSLSCTSSSSYVALWVGMDGFTSTTVEQTGILGECVGGAPTYVAWYELYPRPMHIISSLAISAGDVVSAEVSYVGGAFVISLADLTTGPSFTTSVKVKSAQRSSVEWIVEASSSGGGLLPLANFGVAYFGYDYTFQPQTCYATVNGITGGIGSSVWQVTMVSLSNPSQLKAQPSPLSSDGTSFYVTWLSPGP